jgi:hypothetical protein
LITETGIIPTISSEKVLLGIKFDLANRSVTLDKSFSPADIIKNPNINDLVSLFKVCRFNTESVLSLTKYKDSKYELLLLNLSIRPVSSDERHKIIQELKKIIDSRLVIPKFVLADMYPNLPHITSVRLGVDNSNNGHIYLPMDRYAGQCVTYCRADIQAQLLKLKEYLGSL